MEKEEWKDGVGANEAENSFSMESNEIEQSKVGIMRALVEAEDPSAKVPSSLFFGLLPFSFTSLSACLLVKLLLWGIVLVFEAK
jgi:hypothetical protein